MELVIGFKLATHGNRAKAQRFGVDRAGAELERRIRAAGIEKILRSLFAVELGVLPVSKLDAARGDDQCKRAAPHRRAEALAACGRPGAGAQPAAEDQGVGCGVLVFGVVLVVVGNMVPTAYVGLPHLAFSWYSLLATIYKMAAILVATYWGLVYQCRFP